MNKFLIYLAAGSFLLFLILGINQSMAQDLPIQQKDNIEQNQLEIE